MASAVRIYETEQQAKSAIAQLVENDFSEELILLLTPMQGSPEMLVKAAVSDGKLPGDHGKVAINALQAGRSLVSVDLLFNYGQLALNILDSFNPVDSDRLPEQFIHNPAPFSDFFGFPVLSHRPSSTRLVPAGSSLVFRSFLGLKPLSKRGTPLSSMLGLPLLSSKPRNSRFGMPLISRNPTPLSSMLGLKLLTGPKR